MNAVITKSLNPMQQLSECGQSVWLDYIRASLMSSGALDRMIKEDGLKGLTSNPSIFEKAIVGSNDYNELLETLADRDDLDAAAVFERLAIDDIRRAADHFAPTYRATHKRDGYVSLEVSPALAHDTDGTVLQARRLWREVDRPNLMIKVPATPEGLPAIETLLGEGINVNVTLLFSVDVYAQVAEVFLRALEKRAAADEDLSGIASVASFFVSRVDTAVDKRIVERLNEVSDPSAAETLRAVQGKIAIANAKLAYRHYRQCFSGERWARLEQAGARSQRLLWASTSSKNPAYRDVMYVEELIGRDTVNTLPPATLDAFRAHGVARESLTEKLNDAERALATLSASGIQLDAVTEQLLREGVEAFAGAYDQLLEAITRVRSRHGKQDFAAQFSLPRELRLAADRVIAEFESQDKIRRLWARDKRLWTTQDEDRWLDWLNIAGIQLNHLAELKDIMHFAEGYYYSHVVLLGMGGSSLAPEMFARSFGPQPGHPQLLVLDSTDPAQIRSVESHIDPARTAFIVASKSGTTLEPNLLLDYFLARVGAAVGAARAADHFGVITDPGSPLEARARQAGFRKIFHGVPGIGGRYSALSNFGLVPAAVAGIDVGRVLHQAETMAEACAACVPARDNPGLQLGAVLGAAQRMGRDKVTFVCTPAVASLGAWLEQLLAESTGKQGKALIPVNGERVGPPEAYGPDRLFVHLRMPSRADEEQERAVERLRTAGQPVVQINIRDPHDLGAELFRWEFATAVAGSVMGINAFNQPDVEASKAVARELTTAFERNGRLPQQEPLLQSGPLSFFTTDACAEEWRKRGDEPTAASLLRTHLDQLRPGDYFAVLAYLNRLDESLHAPWQQLRNSVRERYRVATTLGYGPRYLHSTGQAHKGGPNTGLYLMLTADDNGDLAIPGHRAGFGVVQAAQAEGDFRVLAERGRRVLRVHLSGDRTAALHALQSHFTAALAD